MTEHVNGTAVLDDIDAWIDSGKPQTGQVDICLAGDVREEYDQIVVESTGLEQRRSQITAERKEADDNRLTMADGAAVREIDDQLMAVSVEADELQARLEVVKSKMLVSTRTVHMRALDPITYERLQLEHPPRDEDPRDGAFGVNRDTFFVDLVSLCATRLEKPDGTEVAAPSLDQWVKLRSILSSLQWDRVWGLAHSLNRRELTVPKSPMPSGGTPSSATT